MKATKSALILKDFTILNSKCEVIPFDNAKGKDFKETQDSFPIEIDFGIQEDKDETLVFVKVSINSEKESGYSIFSEGVGLFCFDKSQDLSLDERKGLIQFSAVSICITNIRAYIANITSYYPFGKFNFASIDMNELLKQKISKKDS